MSEQTKDYTIVGVVDYECNCLWEQTKDCTIVGVVDYGVIIRQNKPKTIKLTFAASPLHMH